MLCRLSFRGFLIAMSNSWGLFQIIIFLGYGVVALPKHLYKQTDLQAQHDNAMYRVMVCEENLQKSKIELEDLVQTALTVKRMVANEGHRKFVDEMLS